MGKELANTDDLPDPLIGALEAPAMSGVRLFQEDVRRRGSKWLVSNFNRGEAEVPVPAPAHSHSRCAQRIGQQVEGSRSRVVGRG